MERIDELWTLEDLFYNVDGLTRPKVVEWLQNRDLSIEPTTVETILGTYDGWKRGEFFVEGDNVGLRKWHGGSKEQQPSLTLGAQE